MRQVRSSSIEDASSYVFSRVLLLSLITRTMMFIIKRGTKETRSRRGMFYTFVVSVNDPEENSLSPVRGLKASIKSQLLQADSYINVNVFT